VFRGKYDPIFKGRHLRWVHKGGGKKKLFLNCGRVKSSKFEPLFRGGGGERVGGIGRVGGGGGVGGGGFGFCLLFGVFLGGFLEAVKTY